MFQERDHNGTAGPGAVVSGEVSRRTILRGMAAVTGGAALAGAGLATEARAQSTVYASQYGYDPDDSTTALQAALDSQADMVVIDAVGGDWLTGPLFVNRDNVTILLEDGVTVRALPGGFTDGSIGGSQKLLTIEGKDGVTLLGYGAVLAMNKDEYTSGEWRHVLNILSCSNLTIEGVTFRDSGGDGIYLGVSPDLSHPRYNEDVHIKNVVCDNNRRNALSVITVSSLLVEGSAFVNTNGTAPGAGIDVEPNSSVERISDVVFRGCVVSGNQKRGVVVSYAKFQTWTDPLSVLFDDVAVVDQAGGMPGLSVYGAGDLDPGGNIDLRQCLIERHTHTSAVGVFRKSAYGAHLTSERVTVWDVDTPHSYYDTWVCWAHKATGADPIDEYGGLTWTDSVIVTDHYSPFFSVNEEPGALGLANLHGNLTVVGRGATSSAQVTQDLGAAAHDVDHVVNAVVSVPSATVSIAASTTSVAAGDPVDLTVTRQGADLSTPLAVRLAWSGTAQERYDFDGMSGIATIDPGQSSVVLTMTTRRTQPASYVRQVTASILPAVAYDVGSASSVNVTITG